MSNVSSLEVDKSVLFDVLYKAYESTVDRKINLNFIRKIKCSDVDVKITFKLNFAIEYTSDYKPIFSVKCGFSTDSISLRRINYMWNDESNTYITIKKYSTDFGSINQCLMFITDEILHLIDSLRICNVCRVLYRDHRKENDEGSHMTCIYCLFDTVFHNKDEVCVICDENFIKGEYTYTLSCAHTYHSKCILKNFITNVKRDCPLCREIDNGYF